MYSRMTVVKNRTGLHARPASRLAQEAKKYVNCQITITNVDAPEQKHVSAKSVIGILTLGITAGRHVEIAADGDEAQVAVDALIDLIDSGLGE